MSELYNLMFCYLLDFVYIVCKKFSNSFEKKSLFFPKCFSCISFWKYKQITCIYLYKIYTTVVLFEKKTFHLVLSFIRYKTLIITQKNVTFSHLLYIRDLIKLCIIRVIPDCNHIKLERIHSMFLLFKFVYTYFVNMRNVHTCFVLKNCKLYIV